MRLAVRFFPRIFAAATLLTCAAARAEPQPAGAAQGGGAEQRAPQSAAPARPEPKLDIEAYDVSGNTLLDRETVETAVYPYMGPERDREDVAAAVHALEKAYRDRGYPTVVVRVPQQDALNTHIVRIIVHEEPIGRLRVTGAQYSLPSRIREQLPSLKEGDVPNFNRAQKEIAEVNRLPNRQVTPLERPGRKPGTVDVELKVKDTLPVSASATVNNDHALNTTELRTVGSVTYDNLWQLGHTITGTAYLAPQSLDDTEVFSGSYSAPIWGTPWTIVVSGYTSNSNVSALAGTGVIGKGYAVNVRGALQLPNWDDFNQSLTLGFDYKHALQNIFVGNSSIESSIDYFPLDFSYSLSRVTGTDSLSGTASLTLGLRGLGSGVAQFFNNRAFARADFAKLNLDVSYTRNLIFDTMLTANFTGQVTDQPLLSGEEFSAGGLNSLRGYLQSSALGDDGLSASFDIDSPSLAPYVTPLIEPFVGTGILDDWRFYIFSDSAVAWVIESLPEQQSVFSLASFGVGSRLQLLSHFTGNVLMGMPMRNAPGTKAWHPTIQFNATTEF
jgi:hemolysin activation/secretion protein